MPTDVGEFRYKVPKKLCDNLKSYEQFCLYVAKRHFPKAIITNFDDQPEEGKRFYFNADGVAHYIRTWTFDPETRITEHSIFKDDDPETPPICLVSKTEH
jgi:hypothetical protein